MSKRRKHKGKRGGDGRPWWKLTTRQKSEELCRRAPPTERDLSPILTSKGIRGWSFRWNERVGSYFPDYTCEPLGLIIEIDGKSHLGKEAADAERQADLEGLGYEVHRLKSSMPIDAKLSAIDVIVCRRLTTLGMTPSPTMLEQRKAHAEHIDRLAN